MIVHAIIMSQGREAEKAIAKKSIGGEKLLAYEKINTVNESENSSIYSVVLIYLAW